MKRLDENFFHRDALEVAPELVGKTIVSKINGSEVRVRITETEVYRGEEDTACHAHKAGQSALRYFTEGAALFTFISVTVCIG